MSVTEIYEALRRAGYSHADALGNARAIARFEALRTQEAL